MTNTYPQWGIFLDFDGTVADHVGKIPASTIAAIAKARDCGHKVFLATGRSHAEIDQEVYDLGFDGLITAAGGFTDLGGELLAASTMTPAQVRRIVAVITGLGLDFCLQYQDALYASEQMVAIINEARAGGPAPFKPKKLVPAIVETGVAKAVFASKDLGSFGVVNKELGSEFSVITGTIPYLGTGSGEISDPHINKAAGVEHILAATGIDPAHTLAIGDAANDLQMLTTCGIGVAMGNASDEVKQRADYVTSDVANDGLAQAFARFLPGMSAE